MRNAVTGLLILAFAVGLCWAVVVVGQAHAMDWITILIGPDRASNEPPMVETVFNVIIFAPLIVVAIAASLVERRNALKPGRRPLASLGVGLLVGLAGLSVCVLYAWLAGTLATNGPSDATARLLLWGLGVTAFQVVAEEVYFRGWLQPALAARWGQAAGIAAAAAAFGTLHLAGVPEHRLSAVSLANLFGGGVMFGLFAARGGGLAAAIGVHFAWNAAEQLGWGLDPNPGSGSFGAMMDKELVGSALWGGSGEGLNGSIGMTVALLAIIAPLALLSWRRLATPARPAIAPARRG